MIVELMQYNYVYVSVQSDEAFAVHQQEGEILFERRRR